jgi:hypothetical protein
MFDIGDNVIVAIAYMVDSPGTVEGVHRVINPWFGMYPYENSEYLLSYDVRLGYKGTWLNIGNTSYGNSTVLHGLEENRLTAA